MCFSAFLVFLFISFLIIFIFIWNFSISSLMNHLVPFYHTVLFQTFLIIILITFIVIKIFHWRLSITINLLQLILVF